MATEEPKDRSLLLVFRYWMRRPIFRLILTTTAILSFVFLVSSLIDSGKARSPTSSGLSTRIRNIFSSEPKAPAPKFLWSYIPGLDEAMEGSADDEGWTWLNSQRRPGYTRLSRGGLSQQGPKASLRTNLKEGKQYFTTFFSGPIHFQFMEVSHTLLVAIKTGRIPILPAFLPETQYMTSASPWLSVQEVFDLTGISQKYDMPIVDMLELKVPHIHWAEWLNAKRHHTVVYDGEIPQMRSEKEMKAGAEEGGRSHVSQWLQPGDTIKAEKATTDELHCWSGSLAIGTQTGELGMYPALPNPFHRNTPNYGNIAFEGTANAIKAYSKAGDTLHPDTVERLKEVGYPPSIMKPDDQITCLDHTFHMSTNANTNEARTELRRGTGAWDAVGKYMKFQPGLVRMAEDLVRHLLDVPYNAPMPLYLAVHIRRGDLISNYRDTTQRQWAYMAWELLHEFKEDRGIRVPHILFSTDERDPEWLDELTKLGWVLVDHEAVRTGDRLNGWLPTILDSIILSSAQIFLGNPDSTMSLHPYRRVIDWMGGMAYLANRNEQVPKKWEWKEDW